jgi:crotonobetainyl-CoA:carnitine CoA-transferase CaiB-like acyl-CoA transferase
MANILSGVLVAEIGLRGGISVCGSLLAQLGATVVYFETPGGKAGARSQCAAGKLSLLLKDDAHDRALLDAAALRSDVVLISSDIDPPHAQARIPATPGNVVCDLTATGATGPMQGQGLTELQIQALSGIMDTTGFPDGPPVACAIPITDILAGTYCAAGVLAALRVRRCQGRGQRIDMALLDCAFAALGSFLSSVLTTEAGSKSRLGNRHPTVAPWNLYRSNDGWVLICVGNKNQWERLCALMGRDELAARYATQAQRMESVAVIDEHIEAWTSRHSTADCMALLVQATVPCGPIAPIDLHPREDNLLYRGMVRKIGDNASGEEIFVPGSPLRMSLTPGLAPGAIPAPDQDRVQIERLIRDHRPGEPVSNPEKPKPALEGVRIIEIGQYTTAPLCTRQLAHLGAEVVKVEQPGGDQSRTWVPHLGSRSVSFQLNNADKRSIVLDLSSDQGVATLRQLIGTADALVENMKPGTLAKFGLSPAEILRINPRIVYCSISGFGADSLYAKRPAFDMVIQAMSGFMTSVSDGPVPLKSGISTADTMGGEMAIVAVLGALEHRDRTGQGQYIDLSMQDICAWLTRSAWNRPKAQPCAGRLIACSDGYLMAPPSRGADLDAEMKGLTRAEAAARLAASGLAAVPVLSVREASLLPQVAHRRLWFRMPDQDAQWPVLSSPIRLTATPPRVSRLAPAVNADGDEILGGLAPRP